MSRPISFASLHDPDERGLYLCRMRQNARYGSPPHPFRILEWTGSGDVTSLPHRWGCPVSSEQIGSREVLGWSGPVDWPEQPPAVQMPARRQRRHFGDG